MEHVEYAYTRGMSDEEVDARLASEATGVLSLTTGADAYGVPMAHHFDGESLYFRLGRTPDSEKWSAIERTDIASYVLYGVEPTDDPDELASWSVVVRGPLTVLPESEHERFDTAEINESFAPIRVFDEAIEDVEIRIVELETATVTGRTTLSE